MSNEQHRYWLVWGDDTPIVPECPLSLADAVQVFRDAVDGTDIAKVEIRQCTHEELVWAGVAS